MSDVDMVQLVSDWARYLHLGNRQMTQKLFASGAITFFALISLTMVTGCLSPVTLTRAVIVYDDAITEAKSKQLLVNIARAQHHQPIHFTGGLQRRGDLRLSFHGRCNAGIDR